MCCARVVGDIAYGRGDTSTARITRKQRKYAPLVVALRAAGFTVHGTQLGSSLFPDAKNPSLLGASFDHIAVVSLGTTGEINSHIYSIHGAFGISRRSLAPLLLRQSAVSSKLRGVPSPAKLAAGGAGLQARPASAFIAGLAAAQF